MASDVCTEGVLRGAVGVHKPRIILSACGWTVWTAAFIYPARNFKDACVWANHYGHKYCVKKRGSE